MSDPTPSGDAVSDLDAQATRRAYTRALRLLGELIDGPPPVEEMLDQLLAVALAAAPGLAAASVTAVDEDGSLTTAASTAEAATLVDQHEYQAREGPCYVAITSGAETLVEDVHADARWPAFNRRAAELGFGCAAGIPLASGGEILGALNLFGARPGDLDPSTMDTLRRLAPPLSGALHRGNAARRYRRLLASSDQGVEPRGPRDAASRGPGQG